MLSRGGSVTSSQVIGLPWYDPDDYARLRAMMSDPHAMAPDYESWRVSARHNEQVAKDAGLAVVRIALKPEIFAAWCSEHRLPLDSSARMQFVQEATRFQAPQPL
jgi:hypothetical protein